VPTEVIPEDWLLPPERSEAEKKIAALEIEVARLKHHEPQFQIVCSEAENQTTTGILFTWIRHGALTPDELRQLLDQLTSAFPMETDFEPQGMSAMVEHLRSSAFDSVFVPPTKEEIEDYQCNQ